MIAPTDSNAELKRLYGIDLQTLERMYLDWRDNGVPKSVVEARYLRTRRFHGKLFSRLVRKYLDVETQKQHPLTARLALMEHELKRLRVENEALRWQLSLLHEALAASDTVSGVQSQESEGQSADSPLHEEDK